MARIKTYPKDNLITGKEKVIGTDVDGTTLNYELDEIKDWIGDVDPLDPVDPVTTPLDNFALGGVSWTGEGLIYDVWVWKFAINGILYEQLITGKVTLSDGDDTNDRFDRFVINALEATDPITLYVGKVEGEPSADPLLPNLDTLTQAEISFRLTTANEIVDDTTDVEMVYDENNEWANTKLPTNGNLNYTTDPYQGSVCFNVPSSLNGVVGWKNNTMISFNTDSSMVFSLRSSLRRSSRVSVKLVNSVTGAYWTKTLRAVDLSPNGGYIDLVQWQLLQIPFSEFQASSYATEFDTVEITLIKVDDLSLDVIQFQEGIPQPSGTPTKWVDLLDTDNSYTGKAGYKSVVNPTESGMTLIEDTGDFIGGSITNNQIAVGAATPNEIEGDDNFIFDGSGVVILDGSDSIEIYPTLVQIDDITNDGRGVLDGTRVEIRNTAGTVKGELSSSNLSFFKDTFTVNIQPAITPIQNTTLILPDEAGIFALELKGYTVATLPSGTVGDTAYVTDALAPTYLGVVGSGGSVTCKVFFDGSNWIT